MTELDELKKIVRLLEISLSLNGTYAEQLTEEEQTKIYGKILKPKPIQ